MLATQNKLGKQSTTAKILIWLYETRTSFLKNWLCSLSTSWQMIKVNQLLVPDTSFNALINCIVAVQDLYATKCIFQSVDRRPVLICRMVLTFVITKGSGAVVLVAAKLRGSPAELKGAQCSGGKWRPHSAGERYKCWHRQSWAQQSDPGRDSPVSRALVWFCVFIVFRLRVGNASCRSCRTILPLFARTTCVVCRSGCQIAFVWGSISLPSCFCFLVLTSFLWVKHLLFL